MKWLWIVPLGLAVAFAAMIAWGGMLPVAHTATRQARFRKPVETLWSAVTREKTFREDNVNYEVTESLPPHRLTTRIADKNLPYGGSWTYEISPADGGSILRITENGEVYNPFFRFVSKYIMGHTATIDGRLKALAKQFGESITIEN